MVDMPPLTAPNKPIHPMCWRALLLIEPHPSTSSKLWISGAKWQPPPEVPACTMLWLAALLTCLLGWEGVRHYQSAPVAVVRERHRRQYLHRFLRPPPQR